MHGETILCVATRRWKSLWRDSQQIMSRIAKHNRVLYFEPGRNPDRPVSCELWYNAPNFLKLQWEKVHENLIVIQTPSSLPYMRQQLPQTVQRIMMPCVAKINAKLLIRQIRWTMQAFDVTEPILWLYEPRDIDLIGKFGEKLACYYNYDEMADFVGNERIQDLLRIYDNRMSSKVDVVFATSRAQTERRAKLNRHTYFIPNGVDFEQFNRALNPETPIAPEVASLRRPLIGLVGWLGFQVDIDLLIWVAQAYPEASLVLVGPDALPDDAKRRALRALPNVHFCGRKELVELPRFLKAFDVALIPYRVGGHTLTVYPLKLHEYLAAGRSVVATALPELRYFRHVVRIGETYDDFIQQVGAALQEDRAASIETRVAVARENTWDQRVDEIYRVLQRRLVLT